LAAPIRSDFCTFDREFGTILEIGHLQPEFDLDGRLEYSQRIEHSKFLGRDREVALFSPLHTIEWWIGRPV
jgi:hypothetical protein